MNTNIKMTFFFIWKIVIILMYFFIEKMFTFQKINIFFIIFLWKNKTDNKKKIVFSRPNQRLMKAIETKMTIKKEQCNSTITNFSTFVLALALNVTSIKSISSTLSLELHYIFIVYSRDTPMIWEINAISLQSPT